MNPSDVCFLRLDFETFQIMGPVDTLEADANGGGACVDSFAVTVNSGQTVPNLCGLLTGEHSKFRRNQNECKLFRRLFPYSLS